ncbi:transposon protein, putative, CACTA, En/Spm sub-class [Cinnamomum micranthum f. kanehirae]|uniref:Transposon protein, putative, CACTA, En/Spm sub-class n=1 Tax=Cinnamomum micranthum f. kanehirae TaxID=337451 RepID=A0A443NYE3_9MAGN|nr:transposon protein, putative, CACTA, En/Spm sub-class [Cinnamomum micranthum f. kanehirae]
MVIANRFNHSGATVSRYFHKVLNAICKLYPDYVQVPDNPPTPLQIRTNTRFYPYFKDCIGAIDGTHVPAHVPFSLQAQYRNRHGQLSQNCLMACGFDMLFHYVLAGWEGSAADATVLFSTLNRGDRLAVSDGKFYLVDVGFGNAPGFLTPYRGSQRKDNFKWNPRAERVLMDTLLEMKLAGRKVEKNFNNACWEEAITKVREKTGLEPTASNAKNKYKNWRTQYREVKQLLSMSGFGWDDTLKMVTTEDDVWDNLEQAKSKLAKYKRIAVKFYEEIHDLIADDIAEGEIALTGIERSQTNAPETEMDEEYINESLGTQPHGLDDMDEPNLPQPSINSLRRTSIPSRQTSTSRTSKKNKSKTSDEVKETLDRVANAVYALADQMNPHDNIIPKITAAVTSLASIPRHMKMAVINFFVRDHITAVTFMSFDDAKNGFPAPPVKFRVFNVKNRKRE